MRNTFIISVLLLLLAMAYSIPARAADADAVEKALRKASVFFRNHVAAEGGYLWSYSSDLKLREGENPADDQTVWVQPPGTPTVGHAFLRAYRITGDFYYLEAATEVGRCLLRGQLRSGGWTYTVFFDPAKRKQYAYRVDPVVSNSKQQNVSTLDDNTTQSAIGFLMELDAALEFKDEAIHEAVQYAFQELFKAQFPNGAFPQRFWGSKRDPKSYPIKKANYPPEGVEPTHDPDYRKYYTFNDNLALDMNRLFFAAAEVYGKKSDRGIEPNETYLAAARRLGDFILLAQMPEPQPAWAQQYDYEMRPCWARKFEPAAVTAGESQGLITALIELYLFTGEKKYLEPIPKAIAYLKRSRLPDGRVARFYEMQTNKPIYFTKDYKPTYSDADMPTHYAFKINLHSWPIEEYLKMDEPTRLQRLVPLREKFHHAALPRPKAGDVDRVVQSMDDRGAWLSEGILKSDPSQKKRPVITTTRFVQNVNVLLGFLKDQPSKKSK